MFVCADKDTTYVDIDDTTLESETVASLEDAHVRWLVKYTSHPVATATWLDPKRKPITASPKYLISNKINETSLTILNITFEDAGNYSLILNNGRSDARRPFRLIIEGDLVKIHDFIVNYSIPQQENPSST